jgi:hypothetical protein
MSEATILDIHDLLRDAELESISCFELSAARYGEDEDVDEESSADEDEIQPNHFLQIARSESGDAFRVRVRTEIAVSVGRIVSDVAIEYRVATIHVDDISEELMLEFANDVAVMALVPYIRQSVSDITQRVFDSALIMPMVKRGELAFTSADAEEPAIPS